MQETAYLSSEAGREGEKAMAMATGARPSVEVGDGRWEDGCCGVQGRGRGGAGERGEERGLRFRLDLEIGRAHV